jgi:hypothetical protein
MRAGKVAREAPLFEFVSKALLALVLDKRAREALEAANRSPSAHSTKSAGLPSPAEAGRAKSGPSAPGSVKPSPSAPPRGRELTDERRELIRNALAVQRSKQHVFDDLSEDTKAKLLITAVKAMGIPPDEIERSLLGRRKSSNSGPKR